MKQAKTLKKFTFKRCLMLLLAEIMGAMEGLSILPVQRAGKSG